MRGVVGDLGGEVEEAVVAGQIADREAAGLPRLERLEGQPHRLREGRAVGAAHVDRLRQCALPVVELPVHRDGPLVDQVDVHRLLVHRDAVLPRVEAQAQRIGIVRRRCPPDDPELDPLPLARLEAESRRGLDLQLAEGGGEHARDRPIELAGQAHPHDRLLRDGRGHVAGHNVQRLDPADPGLADGSDETREAALPGRVGAEEEALLAKRDGDTAALCQHRVPVDVVERVVLRRGKGHRRVREGHVIGHLRIELRAVWRVLRQCRQLRPQRVLDRDLGEAPHRAEQDASALLPAEERRQLAHDHHRPVVGIPVQAVEDEDPRDARLEQDLPERALADEVLHGTVRGGEGPGLDVPLDALGAALGEDVILCDAMVAEGGDGNAAQASQRAVVAGRAVRGDDAEEAVVGVRRPRLGVPDEHAALVVLSLVPLGVEHG